MNRLTIGAIAAAAATATSAYAYGPGCSYCSATGLTQLAPGSPFLQVSMRWTGITEAPSVMNPASLNCQWNGVNDFKTMMWRRHERASDCVLIPQANFTLRSGGSISVSDYKLLPDADLSVGLAGDIDVVTNGAQELIDAWMAAEVLWAAQPKGIIAISANRLVDGAGTSVARGIAMVGPGGTATITRPWIAVADPAVFMQTNERSLAHEVGHTLGLGHVAGGNNLMRSGGSGSILTAGQVNAMRTSIGANPQLDRGIPNSGDPNRIDFFYDEIGDSLKNLGFQDIYKVAVQDNTLTEERVNFAIGTNGPAFNPFGLRGPAQTDTTWWMALDMDNRRDTGANTGELVGDFDFDGAELVVETIVDSDGRATSSGWVATQLGLFVPIELNPQQFASSLMDFDLIYCDTTRGFDVERVPLFAEVQHSADVGFLGQFFPNGARGDGRLFENGLRAAVAITAFGDQMVDMTDLDVEPLDFPEIVFPQMQIDPGEGFAGDAFQVQASGMTPNAPLAVFFGPSLLSLGEVESDDKGNATFDLSVPLGFPAGPTLLTVGVADPDNAITADAMFTVLESCPADLNGDFDVDATDLGILIASWGPSRGLADLDGSGQIGPTDLGRLVAAWGPCD